MRGRVAVSGGALIVLGGALLLNGCSKKVQPVTSEASTTQDMSSRMREEEEAARRAREAAIAERERRVAEESMRRRTGEQAGMSREDFLNQDVHFAFDSYTLSEDAKARLDQKAAWLRGNTGVAVKIEGHCDERGTSAYNLALGERRATAAKQYLGALGISATRMSTISYGEEFPLDPGHDEAAWAKNRRAHFLITGQ